MELIVYPKSNDKRLINPSPFCAKSEIFLKMASQDFKLKEFAGNPGKYPKKKMPVLSVGGHIIADSAIIQRHIVAEKKLEMDSHLSDSEKAQGFAFSKMAEEFLYWSLLHERWFVDENWLKLRDSYFAHMPKWIRVPIAGMIRGSTKKSAVGHGMSRHSDPEIHQMGSECLKALSDFLGEKTYFLGDKITTYDSTIFAFVASILHSPLGPKLKAVGEGYQNLKDYDERMFLEIFPEGG